MATTEHHFLDAKYDDYVSTNGSSATFFRSSTLILMALLLLRHAVSITTSSDEDASTYFSLFLLRVAGIFLPCYIMTWAINILHRRRQRQGFSKTQDWVIGEKDLFDRDKLLLHALRFSGYHGGKKIDRLFFVDIDAWLELSTASRSDSITDTISYTDLYRIVSEVMNGPPQNLLMSVAHLIANTALLRLPEIHAIRVKVGEHFSAYNPTQLRGVEILRYKNQLG